MNPKSPLLWAASFVLMATVLILGAADTAHATFNPTLELAIAESSAGANSNVSSDFNLPAGDVNFAGVVSFIPGDWGVVSGDEIPIGAVVGRLTARATLGLINGACNNELPVGFNMLNSSIDVTDTVPFEDTDPEAGEPGYDPNNPGNDTEDFIEDRDQTGLPDAFEHYPEFITRVLDDVPGDEVGEPLQPVRRAAGITVVAGVNVLLQFLVFEPGTFINENIPHEEDLGYPTVTLLQNVGDPATDPIPSAITDFCTPLLSSNNGFGVSKDNACTDKSVPIDQLDPLCPVSGVPLEVADESTTEPDEGGIALFTNPAEGTYTFSVIAAGQRDADGDGYENSLDTCAFTANQGDPRVAGEGDLDNDGLDAACDPNDNQTNSDQDLDGYPNRQDNCPQKGNGDPDESGNEGQDNQRDTDDDAIGDACDPNKDDSDTEGELTITKVTADVTIGPGVPGQETPLPTPTSDEDDGGLSSGALIGIIVAIIAGVAVLGGGAFYFMRRGGGGTA